MLIFPSLLSNHDHQKKINYLIEQINHWAHKIKKMPNFHQQSQPQTLIEQLAITLPDVISQRHILSLDQEIKQRIINNNISFSPQAFLTQKQTSEESVVWQILIDNLNTQYLNLKDQLINLILCHYYFKKNQPLIDANNQLGQALIHWQLRKIDLVNQPLSLTDHLRRNQSRYHRLLNQQQVDLFAIFMLQAIKSSLLKIRQKSITVEIQNQSSNSTAYETSTTINHRLNSLIPRRQAVYFLVKSYPNTSLKFIHQQFPTLSSRTIAYDLKRLIELHLVNKHGTTRGARYSITLVANTHKTPH